MFDLKKQNENEEQFEHFKVSAVRCWMYLFTKKLAFYSDSDYSDIFHCTCLTV